ncbi:MAG: hypothetical protein U0798_02275 [Gemmataceae bacterium]
MNSHHSAGHGLGKLKLESLEDRTTPSGNITAVQYRGSIVFTGDKQSNNVLISRVNDTVARITPYKSDGTKINGSYSYDFVSTQNVYFNFTSGGPDSIRFASGSPRMNFGSISATFSDNSTDYFELNGTYVSGGVSISMGGGKTTADSEVARIYGSDIGSLDYSTNRTFVSIRTYGTDNIYIDQSNIRGGVSLVGSTAMNEFYISNTIVGGNVVVKMGDEPNGGNQWTDYFAMSNDILKSSLDVNTGEGKGRVNLNKVNANTINIVNGSSAADEIFLIDVSASDCTLDGGAGLGDVAQIKGGKLAKLRISNIERLI